MAGFLSNQFIHMRIPLLRVSVACSLLCLGIAFPLIFVGYVSNEHLTLMQILAEPATLRWQLPNIDFQAVSNY